MPEPNGRDEGIDVAKAVESARKYMSNTVGNLNMLQFNVESVKVNGSNTKYIVICSVIPDIGKEREYYVIRVDVVTGKLFSPIGKGKLTATGNLDLVDVPVDSRWTD